MKSTALPGTTSRASMASSYSMKPKPFISLMSVILPDPWVLKWSSTSCLVTGSRLNRKHVSCPDLKVERRVPPSAVPYALLRLVECVQESGPRAPLGGVRIVSLGKALRCQMVPGVLREGCGLAAYHCGEGSRDRDGYSTPLSWLDQGSRQLEMNLGIDRRSVICDQRGCWSDRKRRVRRQIREVSAESEA